MNLSVIHGNVLDANAGGLIITIDGSQRGMEGNIARIFAQKWPEVWEEIEDEVPYPLPLGDVYDYKPSSKIPFQLLLIASTLHHRDTLSETAKKSIIRTWF